MKNDDKDRYLDEKSRVLKEKEVFLEKELNQKYIRCKNEKLLFLSCFNFSGLKSSRRTTKP
jgi:hypothetical protein